VPAYAASDVGEAMSESRRRYFHCLGCGGIAGVLLEQFDYLPAGSVFHIKPREHANAVAVQCALYHKLSAKDFARLHEGQPDLPEMAGGTWSDCNEPVTESYLAEWLASQFQRPEQLRSFLDLTREERIACFPGVGALADLDYAGWLELGRLALREMDARATKGVPN